MKIVLVFLLLINISYALEVDEKLTLRIVNTSESKKTILINRGIEDGLAKGDHAKFFVATGVVARGVCIKLSPTRSVWSVYRVVNAPFLAEEQVMKLKITPAVKITKDESRMLVSDDSRLTPKDPRDIGIPLADGADDLRKNEILGAPGDKKENWSEMPIRNLLLKNKEVFGMIHYTGFSENIQPDDNTSEYTHDVTNLSLRIGGEWYFRGEEKWYHRFSFLGVYQKERTEVTSHLGTKLVDDSNEFGLGVNLNLFAFPSQVYRFIHYVNSTLLIGSSQSTYTNGDENSTGNGDSVSAATFGFSFGYGMKYYTPSGFGMRAEFSFISKRDQYNESDFGSRSYTKQRLGPKFNLGLSYRF